MEWTNFIEEKGQDEASNLREIEHEFQYYSTLLKEIILWVSDPALRRFVVNYMTKLSGAEVAPYSQTRENRNKSLFRLCMSILNNNLFEFMSNESYSEPLIEPSDLSVTYKRIFDDQLSTLKTYQSDPEINFYCPKHGVVKNCPSEENSLLFSQLLWMYYWHFVVHENIFLIRNPDYRNLALFWCQIISVMFLSGCSIMRNEAVTLMLGLAVRSTDFELKPPFTSAPKFPLKPLKFIKVKGYEEYSHDPTSKIAQKFVQSMPDIEKGAFAFISVSKDLFERKEK